MTPVERAAEVIDALEPFALEVRDVQRGWLAKEIAQALSDAGMLADPNRVRRLEEVRDRLLVSGGANPAIGKVRFSTWSLRRLTAAFDCAVATLPTPPEDA